PDPARSSSSAVPETPVSTAPSPHLWNTAKEPCFPPDSDCRCTEYFYHRLPQIHPHRIITAVRIRFPEKSRYGCPDPGTGSVRLPWKMFREPWIQSDPESQYH